MATKGNQTTNQTRDAQIIAGVGKYLATQSSISLLGTAYAPNELSNLFQAQISALASLAILKSQVKVAVAAAQSQEKQLGALASALKSYLISTAGNSPTVLGEFGFTPKRVATKDPVTKVVAAAKNLATRKERGTMGSVKKKIVKGTVPATLEVNTVTKETTSPESATTTAPIAPQGTAARPAGTQ
jgi:hypothetical protein